MNVVCDEVRKYEDERAEHADVLTKVELVANLMKNMDLPLEKALTILGISPLEYQKCVDLLNEHKIA